MPLCMGVCVCVNRQLLLPCVWPRCAHIPIRNPIPQSRFAPPRDGKAATTFECQVLFVACHKALHKQL